VFAKQVLTKQALYWLDRISSLFCSGNFGEGVTKLFAQAGLKTAILLISSSQVARITGISHWCLARKICLNIEKSINLMHCVNIMKDKTI
jgi:hypothetical protein